MQQKSFAKQTEIAIFKYDTEDAKNAPVQVSVIPQLWDFALLNNVIMLKSATQETLSIDILLVSENVFEKSRQLLK